MLLTLVRPGPGIQTHTQTQRFLPIFFEFELKNLEFALKRILNFFIQSKIIGKNGSKYALKI